MRGSLYVTGRNIERSPCLVVHFDLAILWPSPIFSSLGHFVSLGGSASDSRGFLPSPTTVFVPYQRSRRASPNLNSPEKQKKLSKDGGPLRALCDR
jgi:hypothetical protein